MSFYSVCINLWLYMCMLKEIMKFQDIFEKENTGFKNCEQSVYLEYFSPDLVHW